MYDSRPAMNVENVVLYVRYQMPIRFTVLNTPQSRILVSKASKINP